MWAKLKAFVRTVFLGGLIVVLPVVLVFLGFRWLFMTITGWIQPLTNVILTHAPLQELVADALSIAIILISCFLVGLGVRTRLGSWLFRALEGSVLRVAPGYTLIKDIVMQFLGAKKPPFATVALVRLFGNDTLTTAFVTDEHPGGYYTVFVPTGPNPTSGMIYHLPARAVHPISVPVETAMRSIIGCGVGSRALVARYRERAEPD